MQKALAGTGWVGPRKRFRWWAILDSNQRPLPCEGSALAN